MSNIYDSCKLNEYISIRDSIVGNLTFHLNKIKKVELGYGKIQERFKVFLKQVVKKKADLNIYTTLPQTNQFFGLVLANKKLYQMFIFQLYENS